MGIGVGLGVGVGEGWSMSTRWIWVGIIDGMVSGVFGVAFCVEGGREVYTTDKGRHGCDGMRCMPN